MHNRFPFTPFPDGIFAVAFSSDIRPAQVISIVFMGEKIALFRTEQGIACALGSYCPHLGADLSCGTVKKESLQCPFHGLRFNQAGCAGQHTVKSWPVFEKYGLIFISHYPTAHPVVLNFPEWDLSAWGKPIAHCFKIRSHPQEVFENSVDQLHFFQVHRYLTVKNTKPFEAIGPEFLIHYALERSEGLLGRFEKNKIAVEIEIHAYGLGLSHVKITLPKYGLQAKQIVFPTPIDGEYIQIRTLTSVKIPEKWRFMPRIIKKHVANLLSYITSKGFLKDFLPDLKIWENKQYILNPQYFDNDGDIAAYRQWAAQFYRVTK